MRRGAVYCLGFLSLAGATACSSATDPATKDRVLDDETPRFTCVDNSPPMRLAADLRANLPPFGQRFPDDAYVAISQSVPGGFAGVFFEDNHFVMTFVDPTTADGARVTIQAAFANHTYPVPQLDVTKAEFRGAKWTFAELDEWFRYLMISNVFAQGTGVSAVDIDEKANTVAFYVIDEASRSLLESKLAALGVPCNLVTTNIMAYAEAL
jgi:hypothetical protein